MPSIVLARCRYKNRQVPLSKGLQPSRAIAKWVGNFNTEWYTLFLVVCIRFYDIRKGTAIWTRRGAYKQRLPFNVNSLKKKSSTVSYYTGWIPNSAVVAWHLSPLLSSRNWVSFSHSQLVFLLVPPKSPSTNTFFFISSF